MGTIKDRNGMDLTEAEDIKMRWQEYVEDLYKKIFMTQIIMKCSLGMSNFLEEISSLSRSIGFPLFLWTNHWGKLAYLSLLFFGTSHSNGYIFPFLLCFLLLFFSQLFVRPPRAAILPFCISFSWECSSSLSPVQCHKLPSIVHQALSDLVP